MRNINTQNLSLVKYNPLIRKDLVEDNKKVQDPLIIEYNSDVWKKLPIRDNKSFRLGSYCTLDVTRSNVIDSIELGNSFRRYDLFNKGNSIGLCLLDVKNEDNSGVAVAPFYKDSQFMVINNGGRLLYFVNNFGYVSGLEDKIVEIKKFESFKNLKNLNSLFISGGSFSTGAFISSEISGNSIKFFAFGACLLGISGIDNCFKDAKERRKLYEQTMNLIF